jgi:hypothetical protein
MQSPIYGYVIPKFQPYCGLGQGILKKKKVSHARSQVKWNLSLFNWPTNNVVFLVVSCCTIENMFTPIYLWDIIFIINKINEQEVQGCTEHIN